jgi:UPF0271 protein
LARIDLAADIGEGSPEESELIPLLTSAHVSTGAYLAAPVPVPDLVSCLNELGVPFGVHPGYPDPAHFGRAEMADPRQHLGSLRRQMADFLPFEPRWMKPHGALYNQSTRSGAAADLLAELLRDFRLPLVGLAGTEHQRIAARAGVRFVSEGFADRTLDAGGRLRPRHETGSILDDPADAAENALRWVGKVDVLSLHGDHSGATSRARCIRKTLAEHGVEVRPWCA